MANPNIWAPGTAISAENSVANQTFTASASQTLFEITDFVYETNLGTLYVFVSGLYQRPGIDFTETSSTSFTLTDPVQDGTIVSVFAFTEVVSGQQYADAAAASAAEAQAILDQINAITISTDAPSGGNNGDIWFQVSA